ncbi:MAG: HtaA domain-containing protein [Mycetocola sp.]
MNLVWGISESLIAYVEAVPDGIVTTCGIVVRDAGEFHFPLASTDSTESGVTCELRFEGEVSLFAHRGALSILLSDPQLTSAGHEGTLSVRSLEGSRIDIAHFGVVGALIDIPPTIPRLSESGSRFFEDNYPPGFAMGPFRLERFESP